jgi:beta-lactamase superfamily II metal-dependent hydrolase
MYNIHLLPARFGDSILIEYGTKASPYYILIDGGPYFGFEAMIKGLKKVAPKITKLELLVVTHVDIDHIDGMITLLNQNVLPFEIKEIWFNGYNELNKVAADTLGAIQGEYLSLLIKKKGISHNTSFKHGVVMVTDDAPLPEKTFEGFKIMLLSPGKDSLIKLRNKWKEEIDTLLEESTIKQRWKEETRYDKQIADLLGESTIEKLQETVVKGDTSAANQSSIAFIGEYKGKKCMFAGDAPTKNLLESITKLPKTNGKVKLDAWKLAHHGSKGSTLDTLMEMIACKNILVSTNGERFQHPDPECIAKIIKHNGPGVEFYFNYDSEVTKKWRDTRGWQEKYNYRCNYPVDPEVGITMKL